MLTGTSGSSSALLESLQSQLKQREGENVQMQMELVRMEKVKSNLTSELARLSHEAEKLEIITSELDELKISYQETEAKYQTMLTVSVNYFNSEIKIRKYYLVYIHFIFIFFFKFLDVRRKSRRDRRIKIRFTRCQRYV